MEDHNDAESGEQLQSRRGFAYAVIYGLGALIGAALAVPAAIYIFLPPKTRKKEAWVDAGDTSQLQPGVPQELTFRREHNDGWKTYSEKDTAWVVKKANGDVTAFAPNCTHLGCAYHWDKGKSEFVCPCHASEFSIDGTVLSGPAPRPLDRFEAKIENARLMLGSVRQSGEASS